jgi:hypothetical protein
VEYILFIDTNVLLDFYRARNDTSLHLLERIDQNHDNIVTTYQVEMEFKKNRQAAILSALKELRKPDFKGSVPAFLKEAKTVASMARSEKQTKEQARKLRERTKRLLANPTTNDPVYKPIQRLFRDDTPLNLSRQKTERYKIRRLAWKRFILGYPPRKPNDTSTGDAINWEWIVECAASQRKHVIIASRDSDYGVTCDNQAYLNDWLLQEFRARVGKKGQVVLTPRLAEAFKLMTVRVTPEEEREEEKLIRQRNEAAKESRFPRATDFSGGVAELSVALQRLIDHFSGPTGGENTARCDEARTETEGGTTGGT